MVHTLYLFAVSRKKRIYDYLRIVTNSESCKHDKHFKICQIT